MSRRWVILAVGLPLYFAFMCGVATLAVWVIADPVEGWMDAADIILDPGDWDLTEGAWWFYCVVPALLLVVTQAAFLIPLVRVPPPKQAEGRPLVLTLLAAGLIAGVLTAALVYALIDIPTTLLEWFDPDGDWLSWSGLILLPVSWAAWSALLFVFARRGQIEGRLERWVGLLLGATLVEVLVVLPIDIMVRRKTNCYCSTGSFHSICLSTWAAVWLAGPGVLLALTSKRRQLWAQTHCRRCGYAKGPSPGSLCPECGRAWA